MPKIVVTESELKKILAASLLLEQDPVPNDTTASQATTDADTGGAAEADDQPIDISLFSRAKLDLIGKIADVNANEWANSVAEARSIDDLKNVAKSNSSDAAQIVDDFLNSCIKSLLEKRQLNVGAAPSYGLDLEAKNDIAIYLGTEAYFLTEADTQSVARNNLVGLGFNVHDLVQGSDSFLNTMVVPERQLNEIVGGLEKYEQTQGYKFLDASAQKKFKDSGSAVSENINKHIDVLNAKYNTSLYRDYLYQPLMAPLTWVTSANKDAPFYTPWKMTWAASNLFYKALAADGVGALRAMFNCLVEYSKKGDRSQKTFRGGEEALNEEFARLAIMQQDELRRVIRASLEIRLDEAGQNKPIIPSITDMATAAYRAFKDEAPEAESALMKSISKLDDVFRTGLRSAQISLENLPESAVQSIKRMSGAGNDQRVIENLFKIIDDKVIDAIRQQSRNPMGFNLSNSSASQAAQNAYNLLLNTILKRANRVEVSPEELKTIEKTIKNLSRQDADDLKRMLDKATDSSRSATANSTMSFSPDYYDLIWNESFGKRLVDLNSRSGVMSIERVGNDFYVTYSNGAGRKFNKSGLAPFIPVDSSTASLTPQEIIDNSDAAIKEIAAANLESIHDNQMNSLIDHLLDPKTSVRDSLSTITGVVDAQVVYRNLMSIPRLTQPYRLAIANINDAFGAGVPIEERTAAIRRIAQSLPQVPSLSSLATLTRFYVSPVPSLISYELGRAGVKDAKSRLLGTAGILGGLILLTSLQEPYLNKDAEWWEKAIKDLRLFLTAPFSYTADERTGGFPVFSVFKELTIAYKDFPLPPALLIDDNTIMETFVNAFASLGRIAVYNQPSVIRQFRFIEEESAGGGVEGLKYKIGTLSQNIQQGIAKGADISLQLVQTGGDPKKINEFARRQVETQTTPFVEAQPDQIPPQFQVLEEKRSQLIVAVEAALNSLDDVTMSFKDLPTLKSVLSDSKDSMIKNYERDIKTGDAALLFTTFIDSIDVYLTEENLLGLGLGILPGTARDDRREMLMSTHYYLDQVYPDEMKIFRENLYNTLSKQTPEETVATLKDVDESFNKIAQTWASVASSMGQVALPLAAEPTK
jgi:hypothetical protein